MVKYIHLGQNYRGIDGRIVRPDESVRFCNLRDADFRKADLSGVDFVGCRFNGASFVGANLTDTKFIGCFIGDDYDPMYLEDINISDTLFIDCHLPYTSMTGSMIKAHLWDSEVAKSATKILSRNNAQRDAGIEELCEIGNPIVAPFLASCLTDNEWDVVLLTLKTLTKLRGQSFPHHDQELLSWMMFSLGHEHSLVREETAEIIRQLQPNDAMLVPVLGQIQSIHPSKQIAGLLTARALYRIDEKYLRLIDIARVKSLFYSQEAAVHDECLRLLDIMDIPLPDDESKILNSV